jgi:hypothetical protein
VGTASGCGGLTNATGTDESLELANVRIENRDDEAHDVHVLFVADDTPQYQATERVEPKTDGDLATSSVGGYPTTPGESVLWVRLDEQPFRERNSRAFAEYDASCLSMVFSVEPEPDGEPSLTIWRSFDPEPCDDGTATGTPESS